MRLCEQIANKWEEYREYGEVEPDRALGLACGSWNRPAWTDKLARGLTLDSVSLAWIDGYIERVTSFVDWIKV